jgi:hypothetical protein
MFLEAVRMIDYSEGYTDMKRLVDDLWQALIHKRFDEATEVCNNIIAAARLTRAQIEIQRKKST